MLSATLRTGQSSLWSLAVWALLLLTLYGLSLAGPWWIFIHLGIHGGFAAGWAAAVPWLLAVSHRPAGINLGPFALGLLANLLGLFGAWFLYLF